MPTIRHCRKKSQTKHSIQRCLERTELYKKDALILMREASRYGISPDKIKDNAALKNKLLYKQNLYNKRYRIYKGYIFVFNKTSDRCITMYKIEDNKKEKEEVNNNDK